MLHIIQPEEKEDVVDAFRYAHHIKGCGPESFERWEDGGWGLVLGCGCGSFKTFAIDNAAFVEAKGEMAEAEKRRTGAVVF